MTEKKRVLVADDEEEWRCALKDALEKMECIVDVASNFREAWKLIDSHDYVLVVSDNNMGLHDAGMELLRYIRKCAKNNKDVSFILHTGDIISSDKEELAKLNGICHIKHLPLHQVLQRQLKV